MKFLIIDDDKTNNAELHLVLSDYGVSDISTTSKQALDILKKSINSELYKAIFVSLELSEKNAIDMLRSIRSIGLGEYSQTLAVLMTESNEMAKVMRVFNKNDVHFIKKPIDKIAISRMVQKIKS